MKAWIFYVPCRPFCPTQLTDDQIINWDCSTFSHSFHTVWCCKCHHSCCSLVLGQCAVIVAWLMKPSHHHNVITDLIQNTNCVICIHPAPWIVHAVQDLGFYHSCTQSRFSSGQRRCFLCCLSVQAFPETGRISQQQPLPRLCSSS